MPYADREKRLEYGRRWRRENQEQYRAAIDRWKDAHPEEVRDYWRKYNSSLKGVLRAVTSNAKARRYQ